MHLWKCDCDFAFMCEACSAPSCLVSARPSRGITRVLRILSQFSAGPSWVSGSFCSCKYHYRDNSQARPRAAWCPKVFPDEPGADSPR